MNIPDEVLKAAGDAWVGAEPYPTVEAAYQVIAEWARKEAARVKFLDREVLAIDDYRDGDACWEAAPTAGATCSLPPNHDGPHRGQVKAFVTLEEWDRATSPLVSPRRNKADAPAAKLDRIEALRLRQDLSDHDLLEAIGEILDEVAYPNGAGPAS